MTQTDIHPQEWHDNRRKYISGSDSPVIVLGDKYPFNKTAYDIWLEKMNLAAKTEPTPAMLRGTYLEPIIADIYAQESDRAVEVEEKYLVHPEYDFIGGNIDRWVTNQDGERGVLEIKCPNMRSFLKCKREGPQDYYLIQLQHYLAVTGASWGSFAIFNPELWELCRYDVPRDDEFINIIMEADIDFWNINILGGFVPDLKLTETKIELPKLDIDTKVVKIEDDNWTDAITNLRIAKELKAEAEEIEAEAKERVQNLMSLQGANIAEGANCRVYWNQQAGRTSFDYKAFAKANPNIDLSPYFKIGNPSRPFKTYFLSETNKEDN